MNALSAMSEIMQIEVVQAFDTSELNVKQSEIVSREDFDIELRKYYSSQSDKTKKPEWTSKRIEQVINLVEGYKLKKIQKEKPTNQQYHHANKYDVLQVGTKKILIMKQETISSTVRQIIPSEYYYDILVKTHIATGHGRRDKIIHTLKENFLVPHFAVNIFLNLCKVCKNKKNIPKIGIAIRPPVTNIFNRRGQVDIIDLQTAPDGDFEWLLTYEDHSTKFCLLRPLKSKHTSEVAIKLLKIFLEVGCPHILQSNNDRKFTAAVIKELIKLWPTCKILNARPRHQQNQESIHYNQDVENMIKAWMKDNNTTQWSIGCYFVQFKKNSSFHRIINKTPFKALFGHEPLTGLSLTHLPINIIEKLENEEDLEKVLKCGNENNENHYEVEKENHTVQKQENLLAKSVSSWDETSGYDNQNSDAAKDCNVIQERENVESMVLGEEINLAIENIKKENIEHEDQAINQFMKNTSQDLHNANPLVISSNLQLKSGSVHQSQVRNEDFVETEQQLKEIKNEHLDETHQNDLEVVSEKVSNCNTEPKTNTQGMPMTRKRRYDITVDKCLRINNLKKQNDEQEEDEFDLFCRSLVIQLKKMPLHRALICQEKLQSVMLQERLSQIYSPSSPQTEQ